MHHHEKLAFFKFFLVYFISIALLILVAGYFYFEQTKNHFLKEEEFSLIEYARHIKMGNSLDEYSKDYHHSFLHVPKHINIKNFTAGTTEFSKLLPMNRNTKYLKVFKSKKSFDEKLWNLKKKIIAMQFLLLLIFAYISYKLAKSALKPLQESIITLDKFAKDLIHDLNTPVTSIQLNMKLIEKIPQLQNNKALIRLNKSINNISELHENLTILLQEETFQIQNQNICQIVQEVVDVQKALYPNIIFHIQCNTFKAKINTHAMKQILQNIISNACKYNVSNGYIKIYHKNNALYIEDNGKGIKEPAKIFERSYSDENSSGLGLDIVKRLAYAMDIKIVVQKNEPSGTTFILSARPE
ncbi:sensor histidine kinase [Sulfurimonas autotrophica]|uniref:histidine kinase n=1 Tax=Sulfurimonas autotrophica (strain ATCC BAA-671 / DSM 16294 / JCM 11897 / OK10) TaxID=563040 RepID=E0USG0_SULAO|nr:HAMP domain-containing sensor histidine kinase [Sulfurimonas autotrophica]ADN09123.1 integral membrane sensor signal transduction histidine kinase [Sulfurimonas autotrophica DSM 16294]